MKWKRSQAKSVTPVIIAEEWLNMTIKAKSKKSGLQAINDIVIIEEDPIGLEQDDRSGLTKDVIKALKESKLVLPEIASGFADKFPFTGRVVSKGDECRMKEVKIGTHVMFPRLGGMRWEKGGKQMINIRESDLHAVIEP